MERIDALLLRRSLLQHPFYVLWSEGKLTREALCGYSKEYYQLVKAVPQCVAKIATQAPKELRAGFAENHAEEHAHIGLWEGFAHGIGIEKEALINHKGLSKTRAAVKRLLLLAESFTGGGVAMYAFEKPLPVISETKLKGLKDFYGIKEAETTEYFRVHATVDIEHARHWREMLLRYGKDTHQDLYADAEGSIAAQHLLLDGCMEAYC